MTAGAFYRDGLRLAVHAVGEGQAMLFQHGLGGDAAQTAEVFPASIGWQGVTLECRGHGSSEAGPFEALSLATFADDLKAFIKTRLKAPVVMGGISMGAALCLRLAVMRPDLVSGLVLARPAWLFEPAPANLAPYALVGDMLARHEPDEARFAFDRTEIARHLSIEAPDNLASLRGFFSREPIAVTRELLTRLAVEDPGVSRSEVEALRLPTLVIGHGQDLAHPQIHAETLARLIPDARLAIITPKAASRERYCNEFRAALGHFLQEFPA